MATMTRLDAWEVRKVEQETLALNRLLLSAVCGCDRCGNDAEGKRLAGLIHDAEAKIVELTDAITDWSGVCA